TMVSCPQGSPRNQGRAVRLRANAPRGHLAADAEPPTLPRAGALGGRGPSPAEFDPAAPAARPHRFRSGSIPAHLKDEHGSSETRPAAFEPRPLISPSWAQGGPARPPKLDG